MGIKKNIKLLLVGDGPWIIFYFFICLAIIYDCIANFKEFSTKEWIKSLLLFLILSWGIYIHFKYGEERSNPKSGCG